MSHTLIITAGVHAAQYVEKTMEGLEATVLAAIKDLGATTLEEVITLIKRTGVSVFLFSDPVDEAEVPVEPVVVPDSADLVV